MRQFKLVITTLMVIFGNLSYIAYGQTKVKVLELGDSTLEGGRPLLENSIKDLMAAVQGLPPVELVNLGLGGDTIDKLLTSGRYETQVKAVKDVDYILVRYGINDYIFTKPFREKFMADYKKLVDKISLMLKLY